MVRVSQTEINNRYYKACVWLQSHQNHKNWTKNDIAFSNKVAYYVPKSYISKGNKDIDDEYIFNLMHAQGWKGMRKNSVKDDTEIDLAGEENPLVKYDIYCKKVLHLLSSKHNCTDIIEELESLFNTMQHILEENIQYTDKDLTIERLQRTIEQLRN